jgi:hypothetical protein
MSDGRRFVFATYGTSDIEEPVTLVLDWQAGGV